MEQHNIIFQLYWFMSQEQKENLQRVFGSIQGGKYIQLYSIIGGRENILFCKEFYVKLITRDFYKDKKSSVYDMEMIRKLLYSFLSSIPFWRNEVALKRARML